MSDLFIRKYNNFSTLSQSKVSDVCQRNTPTRTQAINATVRKKGVEPERREVIQNPKIRTTMLEAGTTGAHIGDVTTLEDFTTMSGGSSIGTHISELPSLARTSNAILNKTSISVLNPTRFYVQKIAF